MPNRRTAADPLKDVRLSDVLTLLAIHRTGSMAAVSRELAVTPSQVSKAIARLEEQLGTTLLRRKSRGAVLTESAVRHLPHLEQLVSRLRRIREEDGSDRSELGIAATSYVAQALLPRLAELYPALRLRALQLRQQRIRALAGDGLFDVAVVHDMAHLPQSWTSVKVGELRHALYGPPSLWARFGPGPLTEAQVRELTFVCPIHLEGAHYVPGDDRCPLPRTARRVGHETERIGVALELAARSGQVAFGPDLEALSLVRLGQLVRFPVAGWDVREHLYVACNPDRVRAWAQSGIVKILRDLIDELDSDQTVGDGEGALLERQ